MGQGWSRCGHGHSGASALLRVWRQVASTMKLPSFGHCVGWGGLHLLRPFPRFPDSLAVRAEPQWSRPLSRWLLPGPVWTVGAAAVSQYPVGLGWWSPGGPRCSGAAVSQPHQLASLRPDFSITPCSLLCLDLLQPACKPGPLQPVEPGNLGQPDLSHNPAELGTAGVGSLCHLCWQSWLGTSTASQGCSPGPHASLEVLPGWD